MTSSRLWLWGVFCYGQTIPWVIVSNIIFMTSSFKIKEDMENVINIYYVGNDQGEHTYRWPVIWIANVLPVIAFTIELLINKIRIPIHHVLYTIFFQGLYLLISFICEGFSDGEAVYYHSLNWTCTDYSYLQNKTSPFSISSSYLKPY